jgi:hypothetical protein
MKSCHVTWGIVTIGILLTVGVLGLLWSGRTVPEGLWTQYSGVMGILGGIATGRSMATFESGSKVEVDNKGSEPLK